MHNYCVASSRRGIFASDKQKAMPKTFILNDESKVNIYGFRVLNKGIDLTRFNANPVMLNDHWMNNNYVLGLWKNIRVEGTQLLAEPEFDQEDDEAKKIEGKVERGFIKGASMGISFDRSAMEMDIAGNYMLTSCELIEASIVAVPANANALKLFASSGQVLTESEVKLSIQEISLHKNQSQTMKKIALSVAALSALCLSQQPNEDEVGVISSGIEKLKSDLDAAKAKNVELEAKLTAQAKAQATSLVADAIKSGKLTAEGKEHWEKMATDDFAMASAILATMPTKQSLNAQVSNTDAAGVKTMDDFEKLSLEKQLAFKNEHPEAYAKLFA